MSLERRLTNLETRASGADSKWEILMEVRIHLKAVDRHRARENGEDPPPYSQEEIEAMREDDLEVVAGGSVVDHLRDIPGWQSPDAQTTLDKWEEGARRQLEQTEGLPREEWGQVYEDEELHDE